MSQSATARQFAGGGTVQDMENGAIRITTNNLTRGHVDAFYNQVTTIYSDWRRDAPINLLIDVSHGPTTPYFRQRAMELYALARSLPLRTRQAYVVNEHHATELQKFVKLTGLSNEHKVRVFTDERDAVRWLEQRS